jgi:tRNA-splicing ligase RtcB
LSYLEHEALKDYLHDMNIAQTFANMNRKAIIDTIVAHMKLDISEQFTTIHNYIDTENMILRKGAISAKKDEIVLIPLNMRDGSILARGKGNLDWNQSAPHGAGRLMSRGEAKRKLNLQDFQKQMTGIFTTSVSNSTLDEAPDAYKPGNEILDYIEDTV